MKKAILITSVIDIDNTRPLTYSTVRSYFSNEERLRQTVFTIASLDHIIDNETTIFLVDASTTPNAYKGMLAYQKNLVYVDVSIELPEVYNLITTHPNKSFCEAMLQIAFFTKYKDALEEYDYFFKMSGRYFIDGSFNLSLCTEDNLDKCFFKHPLKFEWNDYWGYTIVDRRAEQGDNKIYQYSTVLYGWGKHKHERMIDIFRVIAEFTNNPKTIGYDVETLIYFFTREYQTDIIETSWKVYGWQGTDGHFLRY